MPDWLSQYVPEGWGTTQIVLASLGLTIGTAIVSLLIVGMVIVRIPADYFAGEHPPRVWADRHPFVRWPVVIGKNLFGVFLVALGIVLSLPGVPGQGLLTILIGAMLIDFPGRRKFERWLLRRRGVLKGINKLRSRAGREPLVMELPVGEPPRAE